MMRWLTLVVAMFAGAASSAPSILVSGDATAFGGGGQLVPMDPPLTGEQKREIETVLNTALRFYRKSGLPEPERMQRSGDYYLAYMSQQDPDPQAEGSRAAFTGGLSSSAGLVSVARWALGRQPLTTFLFAKAYYDDPDVTSGDHPHKSKITAVHELFHAIAVSAEGRWPANGGERPEWVSEGITDAIAHYALQDLGIDPRDYLKPGKLALGKSIGLRPYDYPLDLRALPQGDTWMTAKNGLLGQDSRKQFAYMTSSLWRYLLKEETGRQPDWSQTRALLGYDLTAEHQAQPYPAIAWLDSWLKSSHPVWRGLGLRRALPAFLAHFAQWPDEVMRSRRGIYKHGTGTRRTWLGAMFTDGCTLATIEPGRDQAKIDLPIRALAGRCVLLRVPGLPAGSWPLVSVTARVKPGATTSGSEPQLIQQVQLGLRGRNPGQPLEPEKTDDGTVLRWPKLIVDPTSPDTEEEAVLIFSNVAIEAAKTKPVDVELTFTVARTVVRSAVQHDPKTQELPDGRRLDPPPTKPKKAQKTTRAGMTPRRADGIEIALPLGDDSARVALIGDAAMAALGAAGIGVQRRDDYGTEARWRDVAAQEGQSVIAAMQAGADIDGATVTVKLPPVPRGTVGPIRGARVHIEWTDRSYRRLGLSEAISAETEQVQVILTVNDYSAVIGRFRARFDALPDDPEREWSGTLEGEFVMPLAIDETAQPVPREDPLDLFSADFFIAAARSGQAVDVAALRRTAREAYAENAAQNRSAPVVMAGTSSDCDCSCEEFGALDRPVPEVRERCGAQCGNYASLSALCVTQQQTAAGRPRAAVDRDLNACPSSCEALATGSALCQDAVWSLTRGCSISAGHGNAEVECFLALTTDPLPEPQRSDLRQQLVEQLKAMDAEPRRVFVGNMLDGFEQEGRSCASP